MGSLIKRTFAHIMLHGTAASFSLLMLALTPLLFVIGVVKRVKCSQGKTEVEAIAGVLYAHAKIGELIEDFLKMVLGVKDE